MLLLHLIPESLSMSTNSISQAPKTHGIHGHATEAMAHDDHSQLCWQHRCDWWTKGWWCKSTSNSSWPSFCCFLFTHVFERIFYILYEWSVTCPIIERCRVRTKNNHIKRGIAKTLPHAWNDHPGTSWPKGLDQTWSSQKHHQRKPNNHPDAKESHWVIEWVVGKSSYWAL